MGRNIRKRMVLVLAFLLIFMINAYCFENWGTGSGVSLRVPIDARIGGMGDAGSAVLTDANVIYWNPAGSHLLNLSGISISSYKMPFGINASSFSTILNFDSFGTLGLNITYFDFGEILVTTEDDPEGFLGIKESSYDLTFCLNYSDSINDRSSLGFNVKYYESKLASVRANTILFDLGYFYEEDQDTTLAFVVKNVGGAIRYLSEENPIPFQIKLGVARFLFNNLLFAYDIQYTQDIPAMVNLGFDYSLFYNILHLRAGYKINEDQYIKSFGLGICYRRYEFNYSYSPSDSTYLDDVSKISFTFNF